MALRASDQDRERVVDELREHFGEGRLSEEELTERISSAYAAKTLSDLEGMLVDLPSTGTATSPPAAPRRRGRRGGAQAASVRVHTTIYLIVNVLLIAIWAASGGGYFWPIWPILGWGIGLGCHAAPLLAGVGTRPPSRRLERRSTIDQVEASVRAESPSVEPAAAPDGTVTILFSDIVGSTELNARLGDVRWLELLRRHQAIVRRVVGEYGGHVVKAQGDGFMIALPSARRGARCALAIHEAIDAELGTDPDGPVRLRIGMHCGEALREDGDFYGRNVALAARIAGQAAPGEVLASALVKQLADAGGDIGFEDERVVELKGLGEHTLYRVTAPA